MQHTFFQLTFGALGDYIEQPTNLQSSFTPKNAVRFTKLSPAFDSLQETHLQSKTSNAIGSCTSDVPWNQNAEILFFSPQGLSRQVSLLCGSVVSLGWNDTYTSSQTSEIDFPCPTFILVWIAPWFTNFILSRPKERILQAPAVFTSAWKEPHTSKKLLVKVFLVLFWTLRCRLSLL